MYHTKEKLFIPYSERFIHHHCYQVTDSDTRQDKTTTQKTITDYHQDPYPYSIGLLPLPS